MMDVTAINILCCNEFKVQRKTVLFSDLITARKRSLGQGNSFRSVCQEFCPQGGIPACLAYLGIGHMVPPWQGDPDRLL